MSERKELATVEEKCETCRFWEPNSVNTDPGDTDGGYGFCRRLPPAVDWGWELKKFAAKLITADLRDRQQAANDISNANNSADSFPQFTVRPVTEFDEWCGEYQPKPLAPPAPVV